MSGVPYLLSIDHLLSDEERLVWSAAREFCERRVAPVIEQHYEKATFPRELIAEFAEMGFLGGALTGYGCAGMGPVAYGLTMIELERQDSGIRSFCSVQSALAMYPIHAFGSEEQRERFLPGMARGQIIGAFGLTEPNSGSDPGSMHTHARQREAGGDYILTGQKFWITNSPIASRAVKPSSSAPSRRAAPRRHGVSKASAPTSSSAGTRVATRLTSASGKAR